MDVEVATYKHLAFTNQQHSNTVLGRAGTAKHFSCAKMSGLIQREKRTSGLEMHIGPFAAPLQMFMLPASHTNPNKSRIKVLQNAFCAVVQIAADFLQRVQYTQKALGKRGLDSLIGKTYLSIHRGKISSLKNRSHS